VLLIATRKRFPLTPLAYWLILLHAIVLMVGGHYTYAEVPAGDWLRDLVGGERNNYDKLGHLAQGFVPAIVAREILLRNRVIGRRGWLSFLIVCICLAIAAVYELLEWWVALISEEAAESFLGTQGYVWDTQSDMFLAGVGAVLALLILGRIHDRQLQNVPV
jgi:putative membrane protein